ncbi:ABSCISIC ACID-INSENSITIVE 5-like protein 7 [Carex littledalei]|uniref:ABSCISIC ACID-INSENSITIVE 5-like protein 7 n=1 Tax=Carex littledalei TaxID=544730 RepID=A0A833QI20_9POAL|nr:ABSCISIC ACID-INSENSITIVE 5-like protein 7 [Carex littledalei]
MDFTNKGIPDTPLNRQGSIYSLTFDEFQNTLGGGSKDFGSMNMDELLKSIWNAEETQAIVMASGSGPTGADQQAGGIPRQGSLTLPRTISQKTVDQVWREVVGFGSNPGNAGQSSAGPSTNAGGMVTKDEIMHNREPTLGEMTLEEFLVRAGVVREEPAPQMNHFGPTAPTICENNFGELPGSQMLSTPFGGMNNGSVVPGYVRMGPSPVAVNLGSPVDMIGNSSDLSPVPVPYMFKGGIRGRKGGATVEKVVERRQRRMIKNRESAARSRARKQAYMMELEAEIAKLKELNKELQQKQIEMMKIEKPDEVMEMVNQQPRSKRINLRRTYTGPW